MSANSQRLEDGFVHLSEYILLKYLMECAFRRSRLLETWCLMEYAEKGSLADALRVGRLNKPNGLPDLANVLSCLTDIASGETFWITSPLWIAASFHFLITIIAQSKSIVAEMAFRLRCIFSEGASLL